MFAKFNAAYRIKIFLLARISDMRVLALLDNIYHVVCLPFGYLSYRMHRMLERPYFGVWLQSSQGNPFRRKYMHACVKLMATEIRRQGKLPADATFRVLEIGAYAGASAIQWGLSLKKQEIADAKVYSVDPWSSYLDTQRNRRLPYRIMNHALASGKVFELFNHNIAAAGLTDVCIPIKGDSADALVRFEIESFDLVYIDGDHHLDVVRKDIERAAALLKDGGLLCGDDLEMQLADVDAEHARRGVDNDMIVDPISGVAYHPGVTISVATFLGRKIPCYEGFWVVRKKGPEFLDVVLTEYL